MNDTECLLYWEEVGEHFKKAKRFDQAELCYRHALDFNLDNPVPMNEIGLCYDKRGMHDEALHWFAKATLANPEGACELCNVALKFWWKREFDKALVTVTRSIELDPTFAPAWSTLGMTLLDLRRAEEALAATNRALQLDPTMLNCVWNRALCRITLGDWGGWEDYEVRYNPDNSGQCAFIPEMKPQPPMWKGESLEGKHLLVCKEQGHGDQMMMLRWLPRLEVLSASVTVLAAPALVDIIKLVSPRVTVITETPIYGDFSYMVMICSLPHLFGVTEEKLPVRMPYIDAPKNKAAAFRILIDQFARGRMKVGINYYGQPGPVNDTYRSAKMSDIEQPLLENMDIAWVSLHNNDTENHYNLLYLGTEIRTFADTAAIIENLDLVITIDSGNAHLAAAMGKPVWMLVSTNSDYRWMLERTDTPWYPSMTIFRQTKLGDWSGPIASLRERILAISSRPSPDTSDSRGAPSPDVP